MQGCCHVVGSPSNRKMDITVDYVQYIFKDHNPDISLISHQTDVSKTVLAEDL